MTSRTKSPVLTLSSQLWDHGYTGRCIRLSTLCYTPAYLDSEFTTRDSIQSLKFRGEVSSHWNGETIFSNRSREALRAMLHPDSHTDSAKLQHKTCLWLMISFIAELVVKLTYHGRSLSSLTLKLIQVKSWRRNFQENCIWKDKTLAAARPTSV